MAYVGNTPFGPSCPSPTRVFAQVNTGFRSVRRSVGLAHDPTSQETPARPSWLLKPSTAGSVTSVADEPAELDMADIAALAASAMALAMGCSEASSRAPARIWTSGADSSAVAWTAATLIRP